MKILIILLLLGMGFTQSLIPAITEFYDDGMPKEIKYYQKVGKKIILTKIIIYHNNGQIGSEENYKNGKSNGKWTEYYESGELRWEKYYKDDYRDGKYTLYYSFINIIWFIYSLNT